MARTTTSGHVRLKPHTKLVSIGLVVFIFDSKKQITRKINNQKNKFRFSLSN